MARLRFTIKHLIAVVIYLAVALAALRNANAFWASATYTVAIALISAALVGAFVRKGRGRYTWTGFAIFGWAYLLIGSLPPLAYTFPPGPGPVPRPLLLIEMGFESLQPYINPLTPGTPIVVYSAQVRLAIGVIIFGLIGAILSDLVVAKGDGQSL